MIRVALLGSFPAYKFCNEVNFYRLNTHIVTSWNVNLMHGFYKLNEIEAHFIVHGPVWKTQICKLSDNIFIHYLSHMPKRAFIDHVTKYQYSLRTIGKYVKKMNPDLVHGIGTEHPGPYLAQSLGLPYIITVHGIMNRMIIKDKKQRFDRRFRIAEIEKQVLSSAKYIISINPYVESFVKRINSVAKYYYIPNPINENFYTQNKDEKYDLIFIGIDQKRKRLFDLLKAILILKKKNINITALIVGKDLDNSFYNKCRSFVSQNSLGSSIVFKGQLTQEQIPLLIARSKMLILPSLEETAPMVIAEAMAIGIPCIASNVGGIPYMIDDNKNGILIEPKNVNMLAEKINFLLSNHKIRLKMGNNAKIYARKNYHPLDVSNKTIIAYRDVLKAHHE